MERVDLGQPFHFRCPQHTVGFGASYVWVHNDQAATQFSRDERRGISPNGTLFITNVTQEDIKHIGSQGIRCRMIAGTFYQDSGTLKLKKNNSQQSGKVGRKKGWI